MTTATALLVSALLAPTSDPLAETVESLMSAKRIPGVVVGVVRGGQLVERRAFGFARLEGEEAMTTEHLFQVGSVTKPFTATLAALLIEEGRLESDEPIARWLGEDVPETIGALTVQQLASHTAALPRNPVNRRDRPESPGVMLPYTTPELLAGLSTTKLSGQAGGRWAYSNLGYALLGHVVAQAADESYEELLDARILAPLGMTSSGIHPTPAHEKLLAAHYWPEDKELVERERWEFGDVAGFAGLYSSVDDLARFLAAQYDDGEDALLSPAARQFLHAPVADVDPAQHRSMGCGWFVSAFPGVGPVLGHGGEVDGHSACVAVLPEARVGLIVLANLGGDAAESLCVAIMQQALPAMLR